MIITYIYPDICEQFSCEMCGACCRRDWLVTIDEASYYRNQQLFDQNNTKSEFQQAFIPLAEKGAPGEFAYIAKGAYGCWFLNINNQCQLHKTAGHDHLDTVCQTYPRYPMTTARGLELTLSFSCPAVIKLVSRPEPLTIIRSAQPPTAINPDCAVVSVYPRQQPEYSPLRYYFELEQHCIDILQCRKMPIPQRLSLLQYTLEDISQLAPNNLLPQRLNAIFYKNYETMDQLITEERPEFCTADIMAEHFFVNLIFKKIFYIYGFLRTLHFLQSNWQAISNMRTGTNPQEELTKTIAVIMEIELQYGHNRQALFSKSVT